MSREELRRQWRLKVEEFDASGQSASRFCREQGLKYAQFLRWRKKFLTADSIPDSAPIFQEINSPTRLTLSSGGLELEVDNRIDFHSLVQVIGALCRAAELRR